MYVTETTRHAHFILPPVSPLEREDVSLLTPVFQVRNAVRYQHRSFDPPPGSFEDWEILTRLALELLPGPARRMLTPIRSRLVSAIDPLRVAALAVATGPHGRLRRAAPASRCGTSARARGVDSVRSARACAR